MTMHEEVIALLERADSPSTESESESESEKETIFSPINKRKPAGHSAPWLTIALSTFVLVDLVVYCYFAFKFLAPLGSVDDLELRNSYIGLEELYAYGVVNSSHHDPIVNKPRIVGQMYPSEPYKTAPQDEHLILTPYGRMAPPDRRLQVTNQVHTLYQFRVIDFGMERCQLALRLPTLDATLPDPYRFYGDSDTVLVEVCESPTSDRLLDLATLSWASRPQCRAHVGTFAATPGREVTLSEFPCKWGEVRTFEMSCASQNPDCVVDVWSSQNETWGIFMYQHQTV